MSAATFDRYARHDARHRRAELRAKIARRELTVQVRNAGGRVRPAREGHAR